MSKFTAVFRVRIRMYATVTGGAVYASAGGTTGKWD